MSRWRSCYGYFKNGEDTATYVATNEVGLGAFYDQLVPSSYDTVIYVMQLVDGACFAYDTTLLVMDFGIFIPSVFTPNEDDKYDLWEIENIDKFEGASVQVFNRWGSLVFESTDYPNNKFDGTFNGEALPVASYYYIVDLKNGAKLFSGAVSIIR